MSLDSYHPMPAAAFVGASGPAAPSGLGRSLRAAPVSTLGSSDAAAPPAAEGSNFNSLLAFPAAVATALGASSVAGRRRKQGKRTQRVRVQQASGDAEGLVNYTPMCKDTEAPDSMRRRFEMVCAEAQERICREIEELDGGAKFCREPYSRESGGGGVARVLKEGNVFEKAGVNLSVVYGEMPQEALRAATERGADRVGVELKPGEKVPFFACGLSSVMHPKNPHCPTMHFNYRYFETSTGVWWFGGGTDITPSYLDTDDMRHFHGTYKEVCDEHNEEWYPKFKEWADRYFFIKHRGETRGLGGIFFDDFNTEDPEEHLKFSTSCLDAVTKAYIPILRKHKDDTFTEKEKDWQQMRRGRYVEFNLVYDRGTIFGLKMLPSGAGRIESILMSLPETARWEYCHSPEEGSPEAEITDAFRTPREWV